jgi:uncharacterized protein
MRRFGTAFGQLVIPPLTAGKATGTFTLGLVAGAFGSMVGLGGAFVTLPVLGGPLGLSAHHAIGTSAAATIATSIGASMSFLSKKEDPTQGNQTKSETGKEDEKEEELIFGVIPVQRGDVNVISSIFIVASSTICAIFGARYSKKVSDLFIRRAQGIFMMIIGPMVLARDFLPAPSSKSHIAPQSLPSSPSSSSPTSSPYLSPSFGGRLLGIGLISGFLAGFFGVGGGAVVVPALVVIMDFDYKTALGTSMAAMIPTTLSSGLIHARQGTMIIPYAIPLACGCALGRMPCSPCRIDSHR